MSSFLKAPVIGALWLAGLLCAGAGAGCRRNHGPVPSAVEPKTGAAGAGPCGSRPHCTVERRQPLSAHPGQELVTLRFAGGPDAAQDEGRCNQREYWLARPDDDVLLARDCERQGGAHNPARAEAHLDGTRVSLTYVELQSGDTCEVVEAAVQLVPLSVERNGRWRGTARAGRCEQRKSLDHPPLLGEGSLDHPLIALHRNALGPGSLETKTALATPPVAEVGDCPAICDKLLRCKEGPFDTASDCTDACEAAIDDPMSAKTYRCIARVPDCRRIKACSR